MKTIQGAAHNYIMSTTKVPRPRIEPKTPGVTFSYFNTQPLRLIKRVIGSMLAGALGLWTLFSFELHTGLFTFLSQIKIDFHNHCKVRILKTRTTM